MQGWGGRRAGTPQTPPPRSLGSWSDIQHPVWWPLVAYFLCVMKAATQRRQGTSTGRGSSESSL